MKGPALPRGDDNEIAKIHCQILKIFISRSTGPILTKLGVKHSWVKGIQVYSNEGLCPFLRGYNYEIAKIYWRIWKIFFSRTTVPISIKLSTNHPWMKEIQIFEMKNPSFFQGEMITKLWKNIDEFEKSFSPEPLGQFQSNHPWSKGILDYLNEGASHFSKGRYLQNSEPLGQFQPNLAKSILR